MTKFGELIGSKTPTLIDFYTDWEDENNNLHSVLRDVAAALGDKAKVVKLGEPVYQTWGDKIGREYFDKVRSKLGK